MPKMRRDYGPMHWCMLVAALPSPVRHALFAPQATAFANAAAEVQSSPGCSGCASASGTATAIAKAFASASAAAFAQAADKCCPGQSKALSSALSTAVSEQIATATASGGLAAGSWVLQPLEICWLPSWLARQVAAAFDACSGAGSSPAVAAAPAVPLRLPGPALLGCCACRGCNAGHGRLLSSSAQAPAQRRICC